MSHQELQPIVDAIAQLDDARSEFTSEISKVLGDLENLCYQVQARANWVQEQQQQLQAADNQWFDKLSAQIESLSGGDDRQITSLIEELNQRLDRRIESDNESADLAEVKQQNLRLAAELQLARARAAQLTKTVENQQQLIDRDHALNNELVLLRRMLETQQELLGGKEAPELNDSISESDLNDVLKEFSS